MKIFVVHGEDNIKSRKRLELYCDEAKKRGWEVSYVDESQLTLAENISSASLFSSTRFLIHRNINKIPKSDIEWLQNKSDKYSGNLILYSDSQVAKTLISKLPKVTKVEEYKLPVLLWKFLDSFYPGNSKNIIILLHEIVQTKPVEFVFGLLSRLLRDIYWLKKGRDTLNLPSWRMGKLKAQADKFGDDLLESLIEEMSVADVRSKTGNSDLVSLLDFVILTRLE